MCCSSPSPKQGRKLAHVRYRLELPQHLQEPIDPALLDIICEIQSETGCCGTIEIISGYRSPQTNAMLRGRSRGVASKSLHLEGRAVDIRITDLPTHKLRDTAIALQRGGVGYYARNDFVHIDTGRVRTW